MPLPLNASDTGFITLGEVKAHANVTDNSHDDELDLFRGAAEEAVEGIIGPVRHRTVTETVRDPGGLVLLSQWPVLSIDSVTAEGVDVTNTPNVAAGMVEVRAYGTVTITYTVGRAVVPDSVRVAALIIAEHLWTTQRGQAPSVFTDEGVQPVPGMAYSIPNRATDLLRPYMLPPSVA